MASSIQPTDADTEAKTTAMEQDLGHGDQGQDPPASGESGQEGKMNPLLMNEVLKNLFSYFEGDRSNLCRFREVCKDWNEAICPVMKSSVIWPISSTWLTAAHYAEAETKTEPNFLRALTEMKNDVFSTFNIHSNMKYRANGERISHPITAEDHEIIKQFASLAGPLIAALCLSGERLELVSLLLQNLPNLEYLELTDMLGTTECEYQVAQFPKLEAAVFRHIGPGPSGIYMAPELMKQIALIYCSVLENSPQLTSLQIDMLQNLELVFACQNLENLTELLLYDHRQNVIGSQLKSLHLATIMDKCPHLTKFAADVDQNDYGLILEFVAKYAHQLEELSLSNLEFENTDVPHDDEATKGQYYHNTWPACPALKELHLRDWNLHNNFNLNMPSLRVAELHLLICKRPFVYPDHPMTNVRVLTLGDQVPMYQMVDAAMVETAGRIFPNVSELSIRIEDDAGLRAIFTSMPGLKKLTLDLSWFFRNKNVTDSGITGLTKEQLQELTKEKGEDKGKGTRSAAEVSKMRTFPFIGDLKGLQYFSCEYAEEITQASILYGLSALAELNSVRLDRYLRADCDAIMGRKVTI